MNFKPVYGSQSEVFEQAIDAHFAQHSGALLSAMENPTETVLLVAEDKQRLGLLGLLEFGIASAVNVAIRCDSVKYELKDALDVLRKQFPDPRLREKLNLGEGDYSAAVEFLDLCDAFQAARAAALVSNRVC
jgi:hypothetical protein